MRAASPPGGWRHMNLVLAEKNICEDAVLSADFVRRDNL